MVDQIALQTTLRTAKSYTGLALFSGVSSTICLLPSSANQGIVFRRIDLPGHPEIPASLEFASQASRFTKLVNGNASVQMVEHLLSALRGLSIDNVVIEIHGEEIPMGDGSASEFVRLIEECGVVTLNEPRETIQIKEPIYWSQGNVHLVALPFQGSRFSYTLHYPHSPAIGSQYYSFTLTPTLYKSELSSCRTFSLYEEIAPMIEQGFFKGGGLENGVVIQGHQVLNPGGLRFADEPVRHKVLDVIGDLALLGAPIEGHILAIRSGHQSNAAFAKEIWTRYLEKETI